MGQASCAIDPNRHLRVPAFRVVEKSNTAANGRDFNSAVYVFGILHMCSESFTVSILRDSDRGAERFVSQRSS